MNFQSTKISPMVFIIPFAVMFAVIGVAVFGIKKGDTDVRSRASNDQEIACKAQCVQVGGQASVCTGLCHRVVAGQTSCEQESLRFAEATRKMFIGVCSRYSPITKACNQKCQEGLGGYADLPGVTKACFNMCLQVRTGKKTCAQLFQTIPPEAPENIKTLYKTICRSFPKPSATPTGTPSGTPSVTPTGSVSVTPTKTPTPTPISCAVRCVAPDNLSGVAKTMYINNCTNLCNRIKANPNLCPGACDNLGTYKSRCLQKLCN